MIVIWTLQVSENTLWHKVQNSWLALQKFIQWRAEQYFIVTKLLRGLLICGLFTGLPKTHCCSRDTSCSVYCTQHYLISLLNKKTTNNETDCIIQNCLVLLTKVKFPLFHTCRLSLGGLNTLKQFSSGAVDCISLLPHRKTLYVNGIWKKKHKITVNFWFLRYRIYSIKFSQHLFLTWHRGRGVYLTPKACLSSLFMKQKKVIEECAWKKI